MAVLELAVAPDEGPRNPGNRFRRTWTPELVIERVQDWARETGAPPTSGEWEIGRPEKEAEKALAKARAWHDKAAMFHAGQWPGNDTVRRFFGTFSAGLAAAGFEPRPQGRTPRDLTARQLAQLRVRNGGYTAGPSQLAAQIKSVMEARAAGDTDALRSSLYDLAATAMAWCERLSSAPPGDKDGPNV
jgi:hypothetical protein